MESMQDIRSLAGPWRFALDPQNKGISQRWFAGTLEQTISLPGTTDEAGFGELTHEACADRLSRVRRWIGPAWYQKTVRIDPFSNGKKVFLFLERTKNSQVWVDHTWAGCDDSLSTPHEFDLSKLLTPGEHTITILVDNAKLPPVGPCHQVDERTQTNWNGIVGRIELSVVEPIWIRDLQAYPDPGTRTVELVGEAINDTAWSGVGNFQWRAEVVGRESEFAITPVSSGKLLNHGPTTLRAALPIPPEVACWDEFDATRLRITMEVEATPIATPMRDRLSVICGLRQFGTARGQFIINARTTLLRGKLDCALFPLSGYAPMDKAEWLPLLSIAKSYGINHYRFHSWCPRQAAFEAADELGIHLLVELPNKRGITAAGNRDYTPPKEAYETLAEVEGDGGPPAIRTAYLTREGERILRRYGNHPSFVMLTLGNEIGGDEVVMKGMCDHFRALDRRHLYAMGSGHFHWDIRLRDGDEFWVTRDAAKGLLVRGSSYEKPGHVDNKPPSTTVDYGDAIRGIPVPVVAHEIAQYEVYPDFREIAKYTGVLRAKNFGIFRERLDKAGMLDQAMDFFKASGALSVICHREDVEAQLRTSGMGGFHLLDIQDFSGQGTALVGILDVFMDSKGLITPEKWRDFCCETVPLLWMKKYTWTHDEDFCARIRIAHYGPTDLKNQRVSWMLRSGEAIVAEGVIHAELIRTGTVAEIDLIHASLKSITNAAKLTITLALDGTPYRNSYDLWVYPGDIDTTPPAGILVAAELTPQVRAALAAGARVLLMPECGAFKQTVAMAFTTGFWSCMFRMGNRIGPPGVETPGTQGILCYPEHPMFRDVPTEFHGNWQWWQLVKHCDPMILNATPPQFPPDAPGDRRHRPQLQTRLDLPGQGRVRAAADLLDPFAEIAAVSRGAAVSGESLSLCKQR